MPTVRRTPAAEVDLLDIWDYMADDDPIAADRWAATIEESLTMPARQPGMGRLRDQLHTGLRSFPVGRYLIFYFPIDDGINVIRVAHGARDLEALLRPPDSG